MDLFTVFSHAYRFQTSNALSLLEAPENSRNLIGPVGRNQHGDGTSFHLFSRIAIDLLRPRVPTDNNALQRLADDRVVGGLHDRSQSDKGLLSPPALRDVPHDAGKEMLSVLDDFTKGHFQRNLVALLVPPRELCRFPD